MRVHTFFICRKSEVGGTTRNGNNDTSVCPFDMFSMPYFGKFGKICFRIQAFKVFLPILLRDYIQEIQL